MCNEKARIERNALGTMSLSRKEKEKENDTGIRKTATTYRKKT